MLLLLLACSGPKDDTGEPADTADTSDSGDTADSGDSGDTADSGDTGSGNGTPWSDEALASIQAALRQDTRASNAFAASIALWYDGEVVWTAAQGDTTEAGGVEVTPDTLFQIGSDTKKLTALALLRQVDAGRLTLDQSVGSALPGFAFAASPGWEEEATLHDLISHQGGLYDYTPWDEAPADAELYDRTYGVLAEQSWAMATPGKMWNYSNPNFSLAGLATELADGRAWADILEDDVFAPLGMTRTFARREGALADGDVGNSFGFYDFVRDPLDPFAASTYEYGEATPADVTDNGFTRPAGLVWSTAADQARLGGFLITGDDAVLSPESHALLTSGFVRLYPSYPLQSYGYGLFLLDGLTIGADYFDTPVLIHGGNTLSYTSTTWVLPERGLAVSILSNGYGDDFTGTVLAVLEATGVLPEPTAAPTGDWTSETDHAELLGTYFDPGFGTMIVTEEDGALVITIPYLESLGLDGSADLSLALRDVYTFSLRELGQQDITFIADDDGTYTWARNRLFVGTRELTVAPRSGRLTRAQIEAMVAAPHAAMPRLP